MPSQTGYLLMADISGYTAYLTSSEQEHATPILRSLLSTLVEQIGEPMQLGGMEGDAVLAYSTKQEFPDGEAFLGICENLYNAFSERRQNIVMNTNCPCRACANVASLDLKIMAHYGAFEEIQIGPLKDISGADVILVHRMAKTDVKDVTGIASYALFSEAAAKEMNIDAALTPFSQSFEHFGDVPMQVYDLAKAWEKFRRRQERHYISEEDGVWTFRHRFDAPPGAVWECLVRPEMKVRWMHMVSVDVDRPEGRIGPGSGYHCVHEQMEFRYWLTDWQPFDYFSTFFHDPMHEGLTFRETYQVIPCDGGAEVRYTMGPSLDADGARHEDAGAESIAFLDNFWTFAFGELEKLLAEAE
jgi:uncharacterized protein YndB with AHSA1/START domain